MSVIETALPQTQPDLSLVEPRGPHDDLSFETLANRYNFRQTSHDSRVLTRLIIKECQHRPSPVRVLDIGCGRGIARCVDYQWAIRPYVDEYVGIEPDEQVVPEKGIFDRHIAALLENADLPENHFDVAYSSMVMDHG